MKTIIASSVLLVSGVTAFPAIANIPRDVKTRQTGSEGNCGPTPCLTFNAQQQYVDVSPGSAHQYVAPGPGDLRGPCPGLNAAANHNFIPHSGVATQLETVAGLSAAYGLGDDLAEFLAAYAIAIDGDVGTMTWSIGGPQPAPVIGAIGGGPGGISYSHNNYEGDASATRYDAYTNNGDAYSLDMAKFEHLYSLGSEYTIDLLRQQLQYSQGLSENNNPYYFSAEFSGLLVVPAAHYFIINFMSNRTAENPNGYLDGPMLKSFFAITGEPGSFVWNKGQEQIPQNWYRRPLDNPYDIARAVEDVLIGYQEYPGTFKFGGNQGAPNTFAGIDIANFTGGAYNSEMILTNSNNFGCFVFNLMQEFVPDELRSVVRDITPGLDLINSAISPYLGSLDCPQLDGFGQGAFNQFPGYSYSPKSPSQKHKA